MTPEQLEALADEWESDLPPGLCAGNAFAYLMDRADAMADALRQIAAIMRKGDYAWYTVCGDWRDDLVALHGPNGHIVSGLTAEQAKAIIDAHGGSPAFGIAAQNGQKS